MLHRTLFWFVLIGLILAPIEAKAWNETGHMIVAKLAWERLDANQKESASLVLKQLPYCEKFLGERQKPADVAEAEWLFLNASTWHDWLRDFGTKGTRPNSTIYKYHIGPRHYINLSLVDPDYAVDYSLLKLKKSDENIVHGLNVCVRQLKDSNTSAEDKAVALAWVLHLTGDIHQPLHSTSYFSKNFKYGDEGGNKQSVAPKLSFHYYWDCLPGESFGFGRAPFPPESSSKIYQVVLSRYQDLKDVEIPQDRIKPGDYQGWVEETFVLAKENAYRFEGKMVAAEAMVTLPEGYESASRRLAMAQVSLASHRLAVQIADLFQKK